jgi:hypothetical protein
VIIKEGLQLGLKFGQDVDKSRKNFKKKREFTAKFGRFRDKSPKKLPLLATPLFDRF